MKIRLSQFSFYSKVLTFQMHVAAVVNNINIIIDSSQRTYADISVSCCSAEVSHCGGFGGFMNLSNL